LRQIVKIAAVFMGVFAVCACVAAFHGENAVDASLTEQQIKQTYTVIIDAGHGGMDGGAESDGVLEKDINLAVAKKLETLMKAAGYNVIMTRSEDVSLETEGNTVRARKNSDIRNRLAVIQKTPSAVFVSIHMNKFPDKKYWGAQVFYSENNGESAILAEKIQTSMKINVAPDNNRAIKPSAGSSYILKNTNAPAVIVECGFMSNSEELKLLCDEKYQKKTAFAVFYGIINYFNEKDA